MTPRRIRVVVELTPREFGQLLDERATITIDTFGAWSCQSVGIASVLLDKLRRAAKVAYRVAAADESTRPKPSRRKAKP